MIPYFNKILEFAHDVSSAINFGKPCLMHCQVTEVSYSFSTRLLLLHCGKYFLSGLLYVCLLNRICSHFFLSVAISHCFKPWQRHMAIFCSKSKYNLPDFFSLTFTLIFNSLINWLGDSSVIQTFHLRQFYSHISTTCQ